MYQRLESRLARLTDCPSDKAAPRGGIGLEKESLRVSNTGGIALSPHPAILGAPLTHRFITTDYSEALIELITPPCNSAEEALQFLHDLHQFVYQRLDGEMLWATSMPCILDGGKNIPIAHYGSSNAGTMKSVYRRGLGYRYGRTMQVIAGVHFNYSLPEEFWPKFSALEKNREPLRAFIDHHYFRMARNIQRFGWIILYLFGASPAVCKSFLGGKPTSLTPYKHHTYYGPYATSLRMGDIGYSNKKETGAGMNVCYNHIDAYIESLTRAISTPSPTWKKIGVKVDGEYRQLNSNILQIENEHYATVRPKQLLEERGMEKPTLALKRRGVRYIELRSLDINASHPLGVSKKQLRFIEAFMLFALLQESPVISEAERREIDHNLELVAHQGRKPALQLLHQGSPVLLKEWAQQICENMQGICRWLDGDDPKQPYTESLIQQTAIAQNPEGTPSARMMDEILDNGGFFAFANQVSKQHQLYFSSLNIKKTGQQQFEKEATRSHEEQLSIETEDTLSFDQFLQNYFDQK